MIHTELKLISVGNINKFTIIIPNFIINRNNNCLCSFRWFTRILEYFIAFISQHFKKLKTGFVMLNKFVLTCKCLFKKFCKVFIFMDFHLISMQKIVRKHFKTFPFYSEYIRLSFHHIC